ncbi:MAG: class I SAM-dependent methyltransferase, partial [Opitutales bacterium]
MSNDTDPKQFYDQFAIKLARDMLSGNARMEKAIIFACSLLQGHFRKSVLDLGCGIGWSSFEFSRAVPEAQVQGLDLSPTLISVARMMFPGSDKLQFESGDLTEASWQQGRAGKYDACMMLDVYEHIPAAFRPVFHASLASVLSPDAVIGLSCPTTLHQDYLRKFQPEGLQPVDEDISLEVIQTLAAQTSSEVVYFEYVSIWAS